TRTNSSSNRRTASRPCSGAAAGPWGRNARRRNSESHLESLPAVPYQDLYNRRLWTDTLDPPHEDESRMPVGYLSLVLRAHLPYVRHPETGDFLEEDWLYEAITETYVPLLEVFQGLERDGVDWRLTMSVTPTLAAMLSDPLLQYRYVRHIDNLIALAGKEIERTRWQPEFNHLALMYHHRFLRAREMFVNQYGNNLLNGFRRFYDAGKLEIITCAATHGFLPLMNVNRNALRAQIEIGAREFARHFGKRPQGMWLPECGFAPGADELLRDSGIRYFFTDTHGVLFAEPRPR